MNYPQPPVDFTAKAKSGKAAQISATDLMRNFVFATLAVAEYDSNGIQQPFAVDEVTGANGLPQRQLRFNPPPPTSDGKTYQLSSVAGQFLWREGLPEAPSDGNQYFLSVQGNSLSWALAYPPKPTSGTWVLGCVDGVVQWIETEAC